MIKPLIIVLMLSLSMTSLAEEKISAKIDASSGVSKFEVWDDLKQMRPLKVVWDFNFDNPEDVQRALIPVVSAINANTEYGPVAFEPMQNVVVSHGGEAVVWAKRNYKHFKDVIDRARRLSDMGVRFEVCKLAAEVQGYAPEDFPDFIHVVPTGSYALAYWANKGYALIPAGSTTPVRAVNKHNEKFTNRN